MTPGAHIEMVIDILSLWKEENSGDKNVPADSIFEGYVRRRRYIGAKDRKKLGEIYFKTLRYLGTVDYLLKLGRQKTTPRLEVIGTLFWGGDHTLEDFERLLTGANFTSPPLTRDEKYPFRHEVLKEIRLNDLESADLPLWVKASFPEWLEPSITDLWGEDAASQAHALNTLAPLDLRVNTLKSNQEWVMETITKQGFEVSKTPLSPIGIRFPRRIPLGSQDLYTKGVIEIQDESSQLATLLVEPEPNHTVLDLCAGAGGKTLGLAAIMKNKGKIYACDVVEWRLKRSQERLRRAGVHNVECRVLESLKDRWLKRQEARFDRVLVDAPCTGTGTWRRNPDHKWRLKPQDLHELVQEQKLILEAAAPLVKKEGRLIYSTCSFLREENENQIAEFLERNPEFKVLPVYYMWSDYVEGHPLSKESPYLRLTPKDHGTDGFFVAILIKYKDRDNSSTPQKDPSGESET